MSIASELASAASQFISGHHVSITSRAATQVNSNITGDEIITSGAEVTHNVAVMNSLLRNSLDKEGKFWDADAFIISNGSVAFNEHDLITYAGSLYEVDHGEIRRFEGSGIYAYAVLYRKKP